jgi:hypothetical protein
MRFRVRPKPARSMNPFDTGENMPSLNTTLDNLIAMVVVLLALSLVVQAVQASIKKMFKLKSRQIEDSLAHLFQFVLHNDTVAARMPREDQQAAGRLVAWWRGFKAVIAQSPFLRIFTTILHPAEQQEEKFKDAAALYNEVMYKFCAIGRTAMSTRPIFDSMSKGDLLKVVASVDPHKIDSDFPTKFGATKEQFRKFNDLFMEWDDWFKSPQFAAGKFLSADDKARLADFQAKFKPLLADLRLLLSGQGNAGVALESLLKDIAKLRSLKLDDAQKVLDDVRANVTQAAERARLDNQPDVAAALEALAAKVKSLTEGFAAFQRTFNEVFARWVKLEESFDSVMQSFEERYTRSMKSAAVIISFFVVVFLNANFFKVYETISTSDAQREMIMQSRQQVIDALARNATTAAPAPAPPNETPEARAAREKSEQQARDAQAQQTVESWFKASRKEIEENAAVFTGYGFAPITLQDTKAWLGTWGSGHPWTNAKRDLKTLLGWLLMALLLSVGAPFWQDFLESLFGVKNVLRKRSETQNVEQKSGAGQTKQA